MTRADLIRTLLRSRTLYLLTGILLIGVLLTSWVDTIGDPAAVWERFGLLAPAISIPLHAIVAIAPLLPSDLMSVANGTVYGFWLGALLSWIGWYLASFVQFGIGRSLRNDFDVAKWMARSPAWLQRFPVTHPVFLIGARFMPYAGGHLSTLVPGALGVTLGRFAWCTAIAIVPPSLVMAGIGAGLLML
ncbi:MAG TPA: VTT domain-containing protein [Rhodothermales bacterium]|nr:VTT domain-containing protein [Rhodothermales bacterium]